jgi:hypothetical protein
MTTGEHELPPHLARYLDSLSEPATAAEAPRLTITAGYDEGQYLTGRVTPAAAVTPPKTTRPGPGASSAIQADGHVDPAAAARWHQAQAEMAALIRAENRLSAGHPDAGRAELLPASLADWMENRVAELEQAEASQPGIG